MGLDVYIGFAVAFVVSLTLLYIVHCSDEVAYKKFIASYTVPIPDDLETLDNALRFFRIQLTEDVAQELEHKRYKLKQKTGKYMHFWG